MTVPVTIWVLLTAILTLVTFLSIWSRRPSWARTMAVAAFLAAVPVTGASLAFALGWPVPLIAGLTAPGGDWQVLASKQVAGKGVYLLLDVGKPEPRYYWMPWDREVSDELSEEQSKENGGVIASIPYEFSWSITKPQFESLPPPPKFLPDKPPQEEPHRFDNI